MSVDKHEIKAFHNSTTSRQAYFRQTDSANGTGQSAAIGQNNGISQSAGIGSNGKITDATRSDAKRWLVAGSQSPTLLRDNLDELVVERGDSYWSLAKLVVSIRTGRVRHRRKSKQWSKKWRTLTVKHSAKPPRLWSAMSSRYRQKSPKLKRFRLLKGLLIRFTCFELLLWHRNNWSKSILNPLASL